MPIYVVARVYLCARIGRKLGMKHKEGSKLVLIGAMATVATFACDRGRTTPPSPSATTSPAITSTPVPEPTTPAPSPATDTCVGPYSSYWDDPSNAPPAGTTAFRLSQAYPKSLPAIDGRPWLAANPFAATDLQQVRDESDKYIRAVLSYIFEGNVSTPPSESDFTLCKNSMRQWFHVPWMDSNPSKGREYLHGLTRELGSAPQKLSETQQNSEASWAVGFYNARGAFVIGQQFPGSSKNDVQIPTVHLKFPEGTVVGKVLFTTATPDTVPNLRGAPQWHANILPPPCGGSFTGTAPAPGGGTVQCTRTPREMYLAQFDVAVVDERAPLKWVFGTFVFDAAAGTGWQGLRPVGLMWGNDPALRPSGTNPDANPPERRGLTPPANVKESYMFTSTLPDWFKKDLGCAGRLDGPIDNPRSSCMSCHASASVPLTIQPQQVNPCSGATVNRTTVVRAPILGDFSKQCGDGGVDKIWFRNIPQGTPLTDPTICRNTAWVSLDYSLQLGEALANYLVARAANVVATPATPPTASAALAVGPTPPTMKQAKLPPKALLELRRATLVRSSPIVTYRRWLARIRRAARSR
jgi:hypothetical protein